MAQAGGRCIGYKVACTSEIAQAALQIDRPVFGRLMSQTTSPSGTTLAADQFTRRVIEAEFAFRVGADVEPVDGGHAQVTIAEHIDTLIPGIEVVDYRFESWAVGALPIAADNAIHGWWLRGEPVTEWRGGDLRGVGGVGHPRRQGALVHDRLGRGGARSSAQRDGVAGR